MRQGHIADNDKDGVKAYRYKAAFIGLSQDVGK